MTDFCFTYKVKGDRQPHQLKFVTEVLGYKLDYRSDLKTIISDIENEYAMLCSSFLKDTYLSMHRGTGESNPLIWWQIFKSCYVEIAKAARQISVVKEHIMTAMHFDNPMRIDSSLGKMEAELLRLCNHGFFRGVGRFKSFEMPIRICLKLGTYQSLPQPLVYGIDKNTAIGMAMTRKEFKEYLGKS